MPGTVMPKTSSGYLQRTNVGFVREKISCFLNLPFDKSHFIMETCDLSNKPLKRRFKKINPEKLVLFLEENPDAFLKETALLWAKKRQVKEYLGKTADINKENIVYIDETEINSYLYREYAYSERWKKVYVKIKGRKFKRTNIVAAEYGKQIIAPMQYVTLLPVLPKDAVIVMDNASFHHKKQLYEIAGNNNITLIFFPPYSSELNPIEKVGLI